MRGAPADAGSFGAVIASPRDVPTGQAVAVFAARCPITIPAAAALTEAGPPGRCQLVRIADDGDWATSFATALLDRMSAFAGMFLAILRSGNIGIVQHGTAIATACLQLSATTRVHGCLTGGRITNPGHAWASAMERSGLLNAWPAWTSNRSANSRADKSKPRSGIPTTCPRRQADGGLPLVLNGRRARQSGQAPCRAPNACMGSSASAMQDRFIHHGEQTQNRIAQAFRVRFCVRRPPSGSRCSRSRPAGWQSTGGRTEVR